MSRHRLMIALAVGLSVFVLAGTAGCSNPNNNTGGAQYNGTGMMQRNGSNGSSTGNPGGGSNGGPGSGQNGSPGGSMMGGGNSRTNTRTP